MFSTKPPRELRTIADKAPRPVRITVTHYAVFCATLLFWLATLGPFAVSWVVRVRHEALMRRVNDVADLLGEEAARDYLTRQTK